MTRTHFMIFAATATALTACASAPEPTPPPPVTIVTQPVDTCQSISTLRRVVVPEVTKKVIAITQIDNPPYEPIQRREEQTRVVSPEQVYYVDTEGREVTDICELKN